MGAPIGLLPAAGRGVRFGAAGYSKELFPLLLAEGPADAPAAPRPVCELALRGIRRAGAERCIVVVSPEKADVLRVLGAGIVEDLALSYVVQPSPDGLPHAVRCARPWLADADVVFAMPDTVILPDDALARVHAHRLAVGADLALGVFPVDEPGRLGPVELGPDGGVRAILDKPGQTALTNSWGVASWSPAFTELCCRWDAQRAGDRERAIGHAFEHARATGMAVTAVMFERGRMLDIGTPKGLRAALAALASQGVIDSR